MAHDTFLFKSNIYCIFVTKKSRWKTKKKKKKEIFNKTKINGVIKKRNIESWEDNFVDGKNSHGCAIKIGRTKGTVNRGKEEGLTRMEERKRGADRWRYIQRCSRLLCVVARNPMRRWIYISGFFPAGAFLLVLNKYWLGPVPLLLAPPVILKWRVVDWPCDTWNAYYAR